MTPNNYLSPTYNLVLVCSIMVLEFKQSHAITPRMQQKINNSVITFVQGDITKEKVDVIVNAANSSLMGGGGVDGAIHRAGGPAILEECKKIVSKIHSLPTGDAVITTGGNLPARHVIHTVGPVWSNGTRNEPELLRNAYLNSLKCAEENNLKSIAFPSISTGAYRYPLNEAAKIAVSAVIEYLNGNTKIEEVRFVLFSDAIFEAYTKI